MRQYATVSKNLRPEKELEPLKYTAGLCRAIGDWVLKLNASDLLLLKYGMQGQVFNREGADPKFRPREMGRQLRSRILS